MNQTKRILITGGSGYIGRNLHLLFKERGHLLFSPSKSELNLLDIGQTKKFIEETNPDFVIHAAIKGGTVLDTDTYQDAEENIKMYDNLMACIRNESVVIIMSSGSEFDRSKNIYDVVEDDVVLERPADPYGLAKNAIVRKAIESQQVAIYRLFGCFNHDEDDYRFIKRCILNIREGKPISINQNKLMDFFYIDDVCSVMDYLIQNGKGNRLPHMNLVYQDKYSLLDIANIIVDLAGEKNYPINVCNISLGNSYTGNGSRLNLLLNENPQIKLVGLEEGILRTIRKLL